MIDGADHVRVAAAFVDVIDTTTGAFGVVNGTTALDVAEGLGPTELVASTSNV